MREGGREEDWVHNCERGGCLWSGSCIGCHWEVEAPASKGD